MNEGTGEAVHSKCQACGKFAPKVCILHFAQVWYQEIRISWAMLFIAAGRNAFLLLLSLCPSTSASSEHGGMPKDDAQIEALL